MRVNVGLMAKKTELPDEQQLWTIQRTAARWQCHELTVRRKIRRGELKVLRFSPQHVRIPFAEILRHEEEARA
jgi:hypothetical protein